MPKEPRIRTLMDSQHVKVFETLHKSELQYFFHIFWPLWKEISRKNLVLVVSEICRLFVNILTPDDKYSLSVKSSVYWNQFKCYYLKIKKYFRNFFSISGIYMEFGILWNKRIASDYICFCNYRLEKAGLLKCPKSLVSEHLWRVNMLEGPKHCINLQLSIFFIFFDHSETKSLQKLRFSSTSNFETVC